MVQVNNARWELGDALCDTWIAFDVLCCTASILNLAAISFDRSVGYFVSSSELSKLVCGLHAESRLRVDRQEQEIEEPEVERLLGVGVGRDFYRTMQFSAKRGIEIACRLSVCLFVRDVGGL